MLRAAAPRGAIRRTGLAGGMPGVRDVGYEVGAERFDNLARLLATSTSRRQVLKALGVSLAGALAGLAPGRAGADQLQGNDECAHFCNTVFPEDDPLRGVCKSAAAKGEGLCYECGPLAPQPATKELCNGQCLPLCTGGQIRNPATCQCGCPAEAPILCGGTCVAGTCPPGEHFNPITCRCQAVLCPQGGTCGQSAPCGPAGTNCSCFTTVEGIGFCHQLPPDCSDLTPCSSSVECETLSPGMACVETCCGAVCAQPCPTGASTSGRS
jgi:hypothetical protein